MYSTILIYMKQFAPLLVKEQIFYTEILKMYFYGISSKSLTVWENDMKNFLDVFENVKEVFHKEVPKDVTIQEKFLLQEAFNNLLSKQLDANNNNLDSNSKVLVYNLTDSQEKPHLWFSTEKGENLRKGLTDFLSQIKKSPSTTLSLDHNKKMVQIVTTDDGVKKTLKTIDTHIFNSVPDQKGIKVIEEKVIHKKLLELNIKNVLIVSAVAITAGAVGVVLKKTFF